MTEKDNSNNGLANVPYPPSLRRRLAGWLIPAGILTGLAVALGLRIGPSPSPQSTGPIQVSTPAGPTTAELQRLEIEAERLARWQDRVQPRLAVADQACTAAIDQAVGVLSDFIGQRKRGARPFAEAMFSFGSKWKLARANLPGWLGGDAGAHRAYLERQFNEHIFTSQHVKLAVEAAVSTYLDHVQAIENQLLVDIRTDLADLPIEAIPGVDSQEIFAGRFDQLVRETTPQVAEAVGVDVARELGSWVGGDIAARIAVRVLSSVAARLGVSAGILGAGASASWATFGVSVLAAIIVDQVAGWVINWATDPVGNLEARVRQMLDDIGDLVIDGETDILGLRAELAALNAARATMRGEVLRVMVLGPQETPDKQPAVTPADTPVRPEMANFAGSPERACYTSPGQRPGETDANKEWSPEGAN